MYALDTARARHQTSSFHHEQKTCYVSMLLTNSSSQGIWLAGGVAFVD
jgi:hypothetical protein